MNQRELKERIMSDPDLTVADKGHQSALLSDERRGTAAADQGLCSRKRQSAGEKRLDL